jgi:2-amino-4-hydroxy-6-hydroxymethyldihydropteridine diphosphokinase
MRNVVLGLGSNIGDSAAILNGAVADVQATAGLHVTTASPIYETDPVGGPDQDPYLNVVVLARTTLDDHALLAATQAIEQDWHRVRSVRWGPRTLDIDILAIDGEVSDDPAVTIPHPRAHERAFVLVPWLGVDPDAEIAGHGKVSDLLAGMDTSGVRLTSISMSVPADQAPRG